jgi:hypothetical protein
VSSLHSVEQGPEVAVQVLSLVVGVGAPGNTGLGSGISYSPVLIQLVYRWITPFVTSTNGLPETKLILSFMESGPGVPSLLHGVSSLLVFLDMEDLAARRVHDLFPGARIVSTRLLPAASAPRVESGPAGGGGRRTASW